MPATKFQIGDRVCLDTPYYNGDEKLNSHYVTGVAVVDGHWELLKVNGSKVWIPVTNVTHNRANDILAIGDFVKPINPLSGIYTDKYSTYKIVKSSYDAGLKYGLSVNGNIYHHWQRVDNLQLIKSAFDFSKEEAKIGDSLVCLESRRSNLELSKVYTLVGYDWDPRVSKYPQYCIWTGEDSYPESFHSNRFKRITESDLISHTESTFEDVTKSWDI